MDVDASALAERVGVTYQQLQKYETGTNRISATRLYTIAQELNLPIDCFFREAASTPSSQAGAAGDGRQSVDYRVSAATEFGPDLLQCFVSIKDTRVRKAVLDLVRSIMPRRDGVEPIS